MSNVAVFWTTYNKLKPNAGNVKSIICDADEDAEPGTREAVEELLEQVIASGASTGSGISGIFEIQATDGVYSKLPGTPRITPTRFTYRTWDEIEASEAA